LQTIFYYHHDKNVASCDHCCYQDYCDSIPAGGNRENMKKERKRRPAAGQMELWLSPMRTFTILIVYAKYVLGRSHQFDDNLGAEWLLSCNDIL